MSKGVKRKQTMYRLNLILFLLLFVFLLSCSTPPSQPIEGKPKHHTTQGFQNYPPHESSRNTGIMFLFRRIWYSIFPQEMDIDYQLSEDASLKKLEEAKGHNTLTWLGHASFLIRLNGKNILTDPLLTQFAAPVPLLGPKRFSPPGISIENLPPIDMVVISHDHYDHLSASTLESLQNKEKIEVVVPLKLKGFFLNIGYRHITELDWHESVNIDGINFTALPAIHHSGRGLFDLNKTLWASWLIQVNQEKIYFSGDTAYSPTVFKDIGAKYGPIDWGLVSIGTYRPIESVGKNHLIPDQAVRVGVDLKAENLVGMHWGTFNLSDEPPDEPPQLFIESGNSNELSPKLWVMKIGETVLLQQ